MRRLMFMYETRTEIANEDISGQYPRRLYYNTSSGGLVSTYSMYSCLPGSVKTKSYHVLSSKQ